MGQKVDKISLMKGDYLLHEGDESDTIYYIVSGALNVFKRQGDKTVQIGTCYAGEIIGEMSFLYNELRYASVQATGACELLKLHTANLEAIKKTFPVWVNTLVSTLVDRLNRTNSRIHI